MKQRELRFRAWHEESQSLVHFNLREGFSADGYELYRLLILRGSDFQQATGLLDKEGNEIYEGDILEGTDGTHTMRDALYVVSWHPDYAEWTMKFMHKGNPKLTWYEGLMHIYNRSAVIIGNVYANPELIQKP